MSINISVVNQKMYVSSCLECIVAGSQNFVEFKFNLSSNWDGLVTFAQFKQNGRVYNKYLNEDNSVYLPSGIKEGVCTLTLYGSEDMTIGTTNFLTLKIGENIVEPDADENDVPQDLYDKLMEKINNIEVPSGSSLNVATLEEVKGFLGI